LKKLLLFDIDGTLLRAVGATRKAINETLRDLFHARGISEEMSFYAKTDLELFRVAAMAVIGRTFTAEEHTVFSRGYAERLVGQLNSCPFKLMPGVAELLPILAARKDVILGLETGNIEPTAYLKLERGGIRHYFKCGGFGSDNEDRAEIIRTGIERARALDHTTFTDGNIYIIGDSANDVSAGKKAGVQTIAVSTGLINQKEVLAEKPDFYLKDLSDIPAFLRCIGEEDERN
jgi:phosphoglycolate phosphatase